MLHHKEIEKLTIEDEKDEEEIYMKKHALSRLVALTICMSICAGTAMAAPFPDVPEGSDCSAAVERLAQREILRGTGTGFNPDGSVTVAEFSTILGRLAVGNGIDNRANGGDGWSTGYIKWAKEDGIIADDLTGTMTLQQINDSLSAFCRAYGVSAVTASGTTRGDIAIAVDALSSNWLDDVAYTSITTAEDWGPAISKVVLNMGVEINPKSVRADKFSAVSVRDVDGFDFATMTPIPGPQIASRTVTDAYVSDASGNASDSGTYVTLELKIGPDNVEGSPFNFTMPAMVNVMVNVSHIISLKSPLSTVDGQPVSMLPTSGAPAAKITADDSFSESSHVWNDGQKSIELFYGSWLPHDDAKPGSTPLIIWLHGMGEGGKDPTIAAIGNKVVNLTSDDIQKYFGETGAAVLLPQTPTAWLDADGSGASGDSGYLDPQGTNGRSFYTDALKSLIDAYLDGHTEIDRDRVYIGGCSNGGYMTVNMIVEYPGFFAAAYPVCEAYSANWMSDETVEAIKDTPIWLTAAKTDGTVKVYQGTADPTNFNVYVLDKDENGEDIPLDAYSNNLYRRLVDADAADVHYSLFENVVDTSGLYFQADGVTPYEYAGHWSWIYTLNNECVDTIDGKEVTIFEWLSQQSN